MRSKTIKIEAKLPMADKSCGCKNKKKVSEVREKTNLTPVGQCYQVDNCRECVSSEEYVGKDDSGNDVFLPCGWDPDNNDCTVFPESNWYGVTKAPQ